MSPCVDVYDLRRGLLWRDEELILKLFTLDPIMTLRELDYAMRGLGIQQVPWAWMEEPIPPVRHAQWLVELDRRLRRRIGWAQQCAADLHVLREAYRAGDLALVLGAGVSMAANMPGWKDLVAGILDLALSYRQRLIERSQRSSIVSIQGKTYLRDDSQDPEHFVNERNPPPTSDLQSLLEETRQALQTRENYDDQLLLKATEAAQGVLGQDLIAEVRGFLYHSRTLYRTKVHPAIARMIHRPGHPGTLTPRVWSIVTYNFDDLVEQTLREAGHSFTVQLSRKGEMGSLWGGDRAQPSAVDILHVHGFAPNSPEWLAFPFWETDLVFTADQYQIQYGSDSTFTRKVHESFLVNSPVLIIGSSLTDQYTIRELTAAHERRPGWFHYCLMQLPTAYREAPEALSGEHLEQLSQKYRAMGLHVIWIKSHDNIPDILDMIRVPVVDDLFTQAEASHRQGNIIAEEQALLDLLKTSRLPRALFRLALLSDQRGEAEQAIARYREVMCSGHPEWSAKAAENCGAMLEEMGDFDGAQQAYRDGMSGSEKALATRLMFVLGELLAKKGDMDGAETAYRETRQIGTQAAAEFDVLTQALGQLTPMSRQYFAPVLSPVYHESVVLAALRLGAILLQRQELDEAETMLREARAAEPSIAVHAAFHLGLLLNERGRREEAITEFRLCGQRSRSGTFGVGVPQGAFALVLVRGAVE